MTISADDVRHVARLARLSLSQREVTTMATELSTIMNHIDTIRELDLAEVPPTTHAMNVTNVMAEDEPHESLPLEEALRNAPDVATDSFQVPRMRS